MSLPIPSIQPPVQPGQIPVEDLARNPRLTQEQKIGELCRQFEALLLRQILKEAQKTVIRSEFADESMAHDIYQDMMTNELADNLSKSGTIGLARSLQVELTRQWAPADAGKGSSREH